MGKVEGKYQEAVPLLNDFSEMSFNTVLRLLKNRRIEEKRATSQRQKLHKDTTLSHEEERRR